MELHFIEIPKLRKLDDTEEISDMLEAWVAFIQSPDSEVVETLEMSKEEIKEAKSELLKMSVDLKDRYMYEKRKESILEKVSLIESAEEKGIQKGRLEEKILIARNLIINGLDDELILKSTGLEIEIINKLRDENN